MANSVGGSTIPDLRTRLDVNTEEISRCFVAICVGGIVGALLGVVGDRFRWAADVILSVCMVGASVVFMLRPWSMYLEVLIVLSFIEGMFWTCLNAGSTFHSTANRTQITNDFRCSRSVDDDAVVGRRRQRAHAHAALRISSRRDGRPLYRFLLHVNGSAEQKRHFRPSRRQHNNND